MPQPPQNPPDRPPPLGFPVREFQVPYQITRQAQSVWVTRIDVSSTGYTKLPRGTLYSTLPGADQRTVDLYPTLYLLREIIDPADYPMAFRYWSVGQVLTTKTLGQDNLIPEKYRRLVRHVETDELVDAAYVFPTGLTGDQSQVQLAQETIEEARLHIIQEIIDESTDPLLGHEDSEFGSVSIRESIVDDGTAIDSGINVLKSTVTPLGNGKSIKITFSYDQDITTLNSKRKSLGQDNLIPEKYRRLVKHIETDTFVSPTYDFPTGLTGDQTQIKMQQETIARARQTIIEEVIDISQDALAGAEINEWGTLGIYETIVDDGTPAETGATVARSAVTPLGNGKSIKITAKYASLPIALVESSTNQAKQSVAVTRTLQAVADNVPVPTALKDVKTTNIGGRQKVVETQEVPSVFAEKTRQIGTPVVIPERFRAVSGVNTASDVIAGTVPDTVALGAGEVEHAESQRTEFTKQVRTTSFDLLSAPTLHGQEYQRQEDVIIPYEERLEPTGTSAGHARTEISPISGTVDLVKEYDVSAVAAVLNAYLVEFTGVTNLALPDTLESIAVIVDRSEGEGEGTNEVTGTLNTNLRASAQGSASVTAEVIPRVRENTKRNIQTQRKVFFLPLPVTAEDVLTKIGNVQPFPDFQPVAESIAVISQRASVQVSAEIGQSVSLGEIPSITTTTGKSHSQEFIPSSRATFIHATIHGQVGLDFIFGGSDEEAIAKATASVGGQIGSIGGASESLEVPIHLKIYPTSVPGTNVSDIPSGTFLLDVQSSIFGYGFAMIHTETVTL